MQPPEECDDANASNEDACLTSCYRPAVWVASDPHVHSWGCNAQVTPEELAGRLADARIQVGASLVWGLGFGQDRGFFTGRDHPTGRPGVVLHYDLEVSGFPAAKGGHLVLLGLGSIEFSPRPFDEPHSGIPVADWARAQGDRVVAGMAHAHLWPEDGAFPALPGGCCMPFELPVHAVRGRIDFLAVERPGGFPLNPGAFRLWKALQNSGVRIAIAGSSDYSCLNHGFFERTPRTDVLLEGRVTYDAWLGALRQGRTAVAWGADEHLGLRVEGVPIGGEVRARAGDTLRVSLETRFSAAADVQVLVNGSVAGGFRAEPGIQAAEVRLPAGPSAWISARSQRVMTSPVYVIVDGRPIRASAEDTCYLIRYVDHLRRLPLDRGESAGAAFAAYDDAEAILRQRFSEAGGVSCAG